MYHKRGAFFIRFVAFTSDLICVCVCVCGLWSAGTFLHYGVVVFQPLEVHNRGSFFQYVVAGFQPLAGTCSITFSQLLDSECADLSGYVRMT